MTLLRYGYISNGFADHSLEQMVAVLARHGYRGIGITLDHHHLDPFAVTTARIAELRALLTSAGLEPVIETGARYYLDGFRKHRPALVDPAPAGRRRRAEYYARAIDIAAALGARCVSLWSGIQEPGSTATDAWRWLADGLEPLVSQATSCGVTIGFEPEPGMFIESLANYRELKRWVPDLRLTLDLGHLAITENSPLELHIATVQDDLRNVHIEDIRDRKHVHLPFGEGDLDFVALLGALRRVNYQHLVLVELSRHSHEAPVQAQRSVEFLRAAERQAENG
ncbi:MAG: sugar phosphate isomerase/epimerase family protein [Planctomycetota bacterium]